MLNMPVSAIRTKLRQEFERHRYVNQLKTVDVLIFQSSAEFQVRKLPSVYTAANIASPKLRSRVLQILRTPLIENWAS